MRFFLAAVMSLYAVPMLFGGSTGRFNQIQLLEGYSAKRQSAIDAAAWTIEGKNGLTIHFEAGPSEGCAVDWKHRDKYAWSREQIVNHHKVFLALVKPGIRTDPDLDSERGLPPGNVLLVCFPLGTSKGSAANFVAKIASQEEMADMLVMVLTFDPSKALF